MIFKDTLAKPFDPTYLDLVGNLVRTLVDRVIHFYQGTPRDEILFREELQELQDNLLYYEQFKPPVIRYGSLIEPLSAYLKVNSYRQYFAKDVIFELPETQFQTEPSRKPALRKRIYSSKNSTDMNKMFSRHKKAGSFTSSISTHQGCPCRDDTSDRPSNTNNGCPTSSQMCPSCSHHKNKASRSLVSHNYQKEVTQAYDKIIESVVNTKGFKRRRYQSKINSLVGHLQYDG